MRCSALFAPGHRRARAGGGWSCPRTLVPGLEMSRCDGQAHGGCQAGCSTIGLQHLLEGGVAEADPVRGIGIGPNGGSGATLHAGDAHGCHAPAP